MATGRIGLIKAGNDAPRPVNDPSLDGRGADINPQNMPRHAVPLTL
jgi:hypothetical protein